MSIKFGRRRKLKVSLNWPNLVLLR